MPSAIFGVIGPARAEVAQLDQLSTALEHRGRHERRWLGEGIALGVRSSDPLPDPVCEDLVLVADRAPGDSLHREVATSRGRSAASDGRDLADLPGTLTGEFALAAWHQDSRSLLLARDPFGTRPLYLATLPDRRLAFATEIPALLQLADFHPRLDELTLGGLLASDFRDRQRSYFREIERLPPGHLRIVQPGGTRTARYWQLDPTGPERVGRAEDFVEEFRSLLTQAVERRLGPGLTGGELSGGLDSSFVTALANEVTGGSFPSFSAVFPTRPSADETSYIDATTKLQGLDSRRVEAEEPSPLSAVLGPLGGFGFPGWAANAGVSSRVYELAGSAGMTALLSGFDGDTTVSHGYSRLRDLASRGRYLETFRQSRGMTRTYGMPTWPHYRQLMWDHHLWPILRRIPGAARIRPYAHEATRRVLRRPRPFTLRTVLQPEFRAFLASAPRPDAGSPTGSRTERAEHIRAFDSGTLPFALELMDISAARFGIQARYPFGDPDLIAFCVSLPGVAKLDRGWTRLYMRLAAEKHLPEQVRWRRQKSNFSEHFIRGLLETDRALLRETLTSDAAVRRFADMRAVDDLLRRVLTTFDAGGFAAVDTASVLFLYRLATVEHWLHRHRFA
jgi:asparagine synthase (glutamine-hydrolysing)